MQPPAGAAPLALSPLLFALVPHPSRARVWVLACGVVSVVVVFALVADVSYLHRQSDAPALQDVAALNSHILAQEAERLQAQLDVATAKLKMAEAALATEKAKHTAATADGTVAVSVKATAAASASSSPELPVSPFLSPVATRASLLPRASWHCYRNAPWSEMCVYKNICFAGGSGSSANPVWWFPDPDMDAASSLQRPTFHPSKLVWPPSVCMSCGHDVFTGAVGLVRSRCMET